MLFLKGETNTSKEGVGGLPKGETNTSKEGENPSERDDEGGDVFYEAQPENDECCWCSSDNFSTKVTKSKLWLFETRSVLLPAGLGIIRLVCGRPHSSTHEVCI